MIIINKQRTFVKQSNDCIWWSSALWQRVAAQSFIVFIHTFFCKILVQLSLQHLHLLENIRWNLKYLLLEFRGGKPPLILVARFVPEVVPRHCSGGCAQTLFRRLYPLFFDRQNTHTQKECSFIYIDAIFNLSRLIYFYVISILWTRLINYYVTTIKDMPFYWLGEMI